MSKSQKVVPIKVLQEDQRDPLCNAEETVPPNQYGDPVCEDCGQRHRPNGSCRSNR